LAVRANCLHHPMAPAHPTRKVPGAYTITQIPNPEVPVRKTSALVVALFCTLIVPLFQADIAGASRDRKRLKGGRQAQRKTPRRANGVAREQSSKVD
jgi:hypothetical protein